MKKIILVSCLCFFFFVGLVGADTLIGGSSGVYADVDSAGNVKINISSYPASGLPVNATCTSSSATAKVTAYQLSAYQVEATSTGFRVTIYTAGNLPVVVQLPFNVWVTSGVITSITNTVTANIANSPNVFITSGVITSITNAIVASISNAPNVFITSGVISSITDAISANIANSPNVYITSGVITSITNTINASIVNALNVWLTSGTLTSITNPVATENRLETIWACITPITVSSTTASVIFSTTVANEQWANILDYPQGYLAGSYEMYIGTHSAIGASTASTRIPAAVPFPIYKNLNTYGLIIPGGSSAEFSARFKVK